MESMTYIWDIFLDIGDVKHIVYASGKAN